MSGTIEWQMELCGHWTNPSIRWMTLETCVCVSIIRAGAFISDVIVECGVVVEIFRSLASLTHLAFKGDATSTWMHRIPTQHVLATRELVGGDSIAILGCRVGW
jgi:hypothetical protein